VKAFASVLTACTLLTAYSSALAQSYPTRAIRFIVPYGPGGGSDTTSRIVAKPLAEMLGQQIVIDNRPGAGTIIGAELAAKSPPDGYTIFSGITGTMAINPSIYAKLPYDPIKDFAPIAFLGASPNVLLTRTGSAVTSVAQLVAKAKAEPGKITYSTPGVGSISQLAVELLKLRAGVAMVHVPYQGAAPAAQAALAGNVDFASVAVAGMMGMVQGGQLRPIVQTGAGPWPELPGVPTMAEAGIADAVVDTTQMLLAPAGTPQPVIDRLAKEVLAIMRKPEVRDKMLKASFEVKPEGPEALAARIAREVPMWKDIVDKAGLKTN
jgi:tripartite-type tricarboxylate transporter receptor subunit TctC